MKKTILALAVMMLLAGCTSQANAPKQQTSVGTNPPTTSKPSDTEKVSTVNIPLTLVATLRSADKLPAQAVSVSLPLFPGSQKPAKPSPNLTLPYPFTEYAYVGTHEELAPTTVDVAISWFERSFVSLGYGIDSQSKRKSTDGKTKETSYYETFISAKDHLDVWMKFQPQGKNGTLIQYSITEDVTPKRPAASYLPTTITKIVIQPNSEESSSFPLFDGHPSPYTLSDPKDVADLVSQINSLQIDTDRHSGCIGFPVQLLFYDQQGHVITATFGGCEDFDLDDLDFKDDKGVYDWIYKKFGPKH